MFEENQISGSIKTRLVNLSGANKGVGAVVSMKNKRNIRKKENVTEMMNVPEKDRVFAQMSSDVYELVNKRENIGEYNMIVLMSSVTMSLYINRDTDTMVIAFRGTTNFGDALTDIKLALGRLEKSKRFKRDLKSIKNIVNIFKSKCNIIFTGHSLGGTIAALMTEYFPNTRAVVFNSGYGVSMRKVRDNNIHSYTTLGDGVSALGVGKYRYNTVITRPIFEGALKSHSISNMV